MEILLAQRASDAQMNSELRFHIDELTDENIARACLPKKPAAAPSWNLAAASKSKKMCAKSTASAFSTPRSPT